MEFRGSGFGFHLNSEKHGSVEVPYGRIGIYRGA